MRGGDDGFGCLARVASPAGRKCAKWKRSPAATSFMAARLGSFRFGDSLRAACVGHTMARRTRLLSAGRRNGQIYIRLVRRRRAWLGFVIGAGSR
jgi:hypothetical protein